MILPFASALLSGLSASRVLWYMSWMSDVAGVERVRGRMLHEPVHGVGAVAGVAEGPGGAAVGTANALDVGKPGEQMRRVAPQHLPRRGVFDADAVISVGGDGGGVDRMLVGRAHVGLLPRRAAVARAMDKAVVGDDRLGRIVRRDREAEDDFAVAPAAIAAGAGPAGDDVLVVRRVKSIGPRGARIGGLENLRHARGATAGGVHGVEVVLRHRDGQQEIIGHVDPGHLLGPAARAVFERIDAAQISVVVRAEIDARVGRLGRETEKPHLVADFGAGE